MKKILKVDKDGNLVFGEDLFIEPTIDEHGEEFYDIPEGYTDVHYIGGLYKPRLVDGEWFEGKTAEEFAEEALFNSLQPSPQEIADSELEIKILSLLLEMEVI